MSRNGHCVGSLSHKRTLTGPADHEAGALELTVGLEHGVRVDRQPGDHFPSGRKLVIGFEPPDPNGVLNLLDQLPVSSDPRSAIEVELNHCAMPLVERRKHSELTRGGQERNLPLNSVVNGSSYRGLLLLAVGALATGRALRRLHRRIPPAPAA